MGGLPSGAQENQELHWQFSSNPAYGSTQGHKDAMLLGPYGTEDTQATMVVREASKAAPADAQRTWGGDKESNLGCVHALTAGQSPGSCHLFFI